MRNQKSSFKLAVALAASFGLAVIPADAQQTSPAAAAEELLNADREFSRRSSTAKMNVALPAMYADDIIMPVPGGRFIEGKTAAIEALNVNPANAGSSASWVPIRGGISADGQHGFTFGYMTVTRADTADTHFKYLAYWVKKPEGWRVAVYKRAPRPAGDVSLALMPPALPTRMVPPSMDASALTHHATSIDKAERDFSDEAQTIGLPAAFAKHGSSDAVNMGRGPSFEVSAAAIGKSMDQGGPPEPSPVSWAPDKVIVASSGDLGVTIGMIRGNKPEADGSRAAFAFFTIWRKAAIGDRWLYVAE